MVRVDNLFDIRLVNSDGDAHEQVLRTLNNLAVDAKQVRTLERLESKVIVIEISVVDDFGIETFGVSDDHLVDVVGEQRGPLSVALVDVIVHHLHRLTERLLGRLVQVRDRDARRQLRVIRVLGRHRRRRLRRELVQLGRRHSGEDAHAHLLRDDNLRRDANETVGSVFALSLSLSLYRPFIRFHTIRLARWIFKNPPKNPSPGRLNF